MATTTRTETTCDLCGYGGPYSRPEDFQRRDGHDLCKWCAQPAKRGVMSCGGHDATITDDGFTCSCGMTMAMLKLTLARYGRLTAMWAAPDLPTATAAIHVQTPAWPRPY